MTETLARELTQTSDDDLHARTVDVARKEQRTTLYLLVHLQEVERRRLYASLGYGSLWEYSMKALGYSESQTAERVSAMRLMARAKEVRQALEKGTLNVTQAAKAERVLRAEEKEGKKEISSETIQTLLSKVSGKSTRETERVLLSLRPKEERPEKIQALTPEVSEIRFNVSEETRGRIERYWELAGRGSLSDLFTKVLSFYLEEKDPEKRVKRGEGKRSRDPLSPWTVSPLRFGQKNRREPGGRKNSRDLKDLGNSFSPPLEEHDSSTLSIKDTVEYAQEGQEEVKRSRYIAAGAKREVRKRAGGRCEYVDSATKRRCESKFRLEFDHIHPFALGGTSEPGNLRLLCRTHNHYLGDQLFSKDSEYLRVPAFR